MKYVSLIVPLCSLPLLFFMMRDFTRYAEHIIYQNVPYKADGKVQRVKNFIRKKKISVGFFKLEETDKGSVFVFPGPYLEISGGAAKLVDKHLVVRTIHIADVNVAEGKIKGNLIGPEPKKIFWFLLR